MIMHAYLRSSIAYDGARRYLQTQKHVLLFLDQHILSTLDEMIISSTMSSYPNIVLFWMQGIQIKTSPLPDIISMRIKMRISVSPCEYRVNLSLYNQLKGPLLQPVHRGSPIKASTQFADGHRYIPHYRHSFAFKRAVAQCTLHQCRAIFILESSSFLA
jgi:hypothetical protein